MQEAYGRPMGLCVQSAGFEIKADYRVVMVNGEVQREFWRKGTRGYKLSESHMGISSSSSPTAS